MSNAGGWCWRYWEHPPGPFFCHDLDCRAYDAVLAARVATRRRRVRGRLGCWLTDAEDHLLWKGPRPQRAGLRADLVTTVAEAAQWLACRVLGHAFEPANNAFGPREVCAWCQRPKPGTPVVHRRPPPEESRA